MLATASIPAEDAAAGVDTRALSDEEIASFVRLLIVAGADTTYRAYNNTLYQLLLDPHQLAALRADPALIPSAVDESLRIEAPIALIGRIATSPSRSPASTSMPDVRSTST